MKKHYKYTLLIGLFLVISFKVLAQDVLVSGVVLDRDSQDSPFMGVTVAVSRDAAGKKTNLSNATFSDFDGKFNIKTPVNSTLRFTFVGYDSITYKVTGAKSDVKIYMVSSMNLLTETVIIGYENKSMADNTSSVTVINTQDLVNTPVANVMDLLQGRVAGLNIQLNNGTPGGSGSFTIRGISDISMTDGILASSSPLFVVDGIPQEDIKDVDIQAFLSGSGISPISMIPYESIDNIQVLKDAAATSLYGSKGAYGVILINTKKGNSPRPVMSYSNHFSVNTPPRLKDVVVGTAERRARIDQILTNDTSSIYHGYYQLHLIPSLTDSLNTYYNNNTDWQSVFYRTTYNQSHNVSFSGGEQKFNYRVNGNYYEQKGIVTNTNFNRYGISMNMGYRPNNKFDMSANASATIALNSTGSGNALSQTGVANGASGSSLLPPPSLYTSSNDALQAISIEDERTSVSYDASVNMGYRLPLDVRLSGTFGYRYSTEERERFTPGMLNANEAQIEGNSSNSYSLYGRSSLSYDTKILIFRLGITLGAEISSDKRTGNNVTLKTIPSDYIRGPIGHLPRYSGGGASSSRESNTVSFTVAPRFGVTNLGFQLGDDGRGDKYIFNPSVRPERNSAYGSKAKWTINPGFGVKWNIYLEPFMEPFTALSYGALRASWGRTTRYVANIYDIWGSYRLVEDTYKGSSIIPIDFGYLPNADLDPVTATMWNVGADMYFYNRRLTLTAEVYYKQTDNQMRNVGVADHNSFTNVKSTETSLVNYGLEVQLGVRPLPTQSAFDLNCSFNLAINKDVITGLPNQVRQIIDNNRVVNRLGSNALSSYLYVYKGVYATDEDVPVDPATGLRLRVGNNTSKDAYFKAGDPIWVDINGDYIIDEKDLTIVGNAQPRITGGLSFNLRYKSFSINTNSSFTIRRDIINRALADRFKTYNNPISTNLQSLAMPPIDAYNFWTPENRIADYPNPLDYTRANIINPFRDNQTLFMEDGSYLKINGISLSYSVPRKVVDLFNIKSMSVNASVNNIYTFSTYSGISPESVDNLGYDYSGGYPNSRTYSFGLSINF